MFSHALPPRLFTKSVRMAGTVLDAARGQLPYLEREKKGAGVGTGINPLHTQCLPAQP
jgi:hypothetical protein